eukprot:sb/3476094/
MNLNESKIFPRLKLSFCETGSLFSSIGKENVSYRVGIFKTWYNGQKIDPHKRLLSVWRRRPDLSALSNGVWRRHTDYCCFSSNISLVSNSTQHGHDGRPHAEGVHGQEYSRSVELNERSD